MTEWQDGECQICDKSETRVMPCWKCGRKVCEECALHDFSRHQHIVCPSCYDSLLRQRLAKRQVEQNLISAKDEIDTALKLLRKYGGLGEDEIC